MEKPWEPVVSGILEIICGTFKLMGGFGLIIAIIAVESNPYIDIDAFTGGIPVNAVAILWTLTIPLALLGILSILGGIYALQRRNWGLALAGSIAAAMPSSLLGIAAIVLIALSKKDFE